MAVTVVGTPATYGSVNTEATSTIGVTVPAGATKLVLCLSTAVGAAYTISSVVYNGVETMTPGVSLATAGFRNLITAIYYVDNPIATTANIVVTYASSTPRVGAVAFCVTGSGVGVGNTQTANQANTLSLTGNVGDLMVSCLNIEPTTQTIAAQNSQTEQGQGVCSVSTGPRCGGATVAATGSAQTLSWTITGGGQDDEAIVALAIGSTLPFVADEDFAVLPTCPDNTIASVWGGSA